MIGTFRRWVVYAIPFAARLAFKEADSFGGVSGTCSWLKLRREMGIPGVLTLCSGGFWISGSCSALMDFSGGTEEVEWVLMGSGLAWIFFDSVTFVLLACCVDSGVGAVVELDLVACAAVVRWLGMVSAGSASDLCTNVGSFSTDVGPDPSGPLEFFPLEPNELLIFSVENALGI